MACSSMNISTSHLAAASRVGILGENGCLRRSSSGEELYKQATIRRSYSDNSLLSSSTRIRATNSSPRSRTLKSNRPFGIFPNPFPVSTSPTPKKALLFDTEIENDTTTTVDDSLLSDVEMDEEVVGEQRVKRESWVERLLELRTRWKGRKEKDIDCRYGEEEEYCDGEDVCLLDYGETDDEIRVDSESFSKLLVLVPWTDAKKFSKLSYLCNKAYKIPEIEANDLQRYHGLQFITSSLEKKAKAVALNAKLANDSTRRQEGDLENLQQSKRVISPSVAYEIAVSAACHVQNQAKNENHSIACGDALYAGNREVCPTPRGCNNSEMAAQMAATTMTTVVAAKEKEKQMAAEELQSLHSSPCEWFICDDPRAHVRCFVIQGSESLASWQTNLFFEPAKFEETNVSVHRGIYEAAKGMYKQLMPEIQNHLESHGEDARFQFTGHSLGGSLSLLVQMMLVARRVIKPSILLPVVTFGSPFVYCGGENILKQLGLDESMVQNVIMHRDIVPRAFSCSYPRQVKQVLKRLNSSFRSHPCLNKHNMLYSPMGQVFILQPAEEISPSHPLLPRGCSLFLFDKAQPASVRALREFLNNPHPLETLSDPRAYSSEGTIHRDHDSKNYTKAVNGVMKQYTQTAFRKAKKERHMLWPLIAGSPPKYSWTHEGLRENTIAREVMTSV